MENVEMNQTVNLYGCKKATIVIKGKVNAVTIGQEFFNFCPCTILIAVFL